MAIARYIDIDPGLSLTAIVTIAMAHFASTRPLATLLADDPLRQAASRSGRLSARQR
jgi:hypothetical protein